MTRLSLLGLAAGFLTTLAFIPQVLRAWRTRSTRDISRGAFVTFSAGVSLWILYGIAREDLAIVLANGVTLVLSLIILVLKARHG